MGMKIPLVLIELNPIDVRVRIEDREQAPILQGLEQQRPLAACPLLTDAISFSALVAMRHPFPQHPEMVLTTPAMSVRYVWYCHEVSPWLTEENAADAADCLL